MPGYSQDQLDRARKPFRVEQDRNDAVAVLGHLLTEQREGHSDERAAAIRTITTAVQDFDTRTALGAPASSFAGPSGLPALASVVRPPAPSGSASPSIPVASQPVSPAAPTASMRRELERQGMVERQVGAGPVATASMTRELKRAGLIPR